MDKTDKDWEEFSRRNAYFAVLTDPAYAAPELDAATEHQFFATGQEHIGRVAGVLREKFGFDDRIIRTAVDFGSGVGRLLFPMSKLARFGIGIDVAETMRELSRKQAAARGITNVSMVPTADHILNVAEDVDWINSYIVFQHISPDRGYEIFDKLVYILKPGGFMSMHFTVFKDERAIHYMTNRTKYFSNRPAGVASLLLQPEHEGEPQMQMYDYDLNQLLAILVKHDVGNIWLEHEDQGGLHGVNIFARK